MSDETWWKSLETRAPVYDQEAWDRYRAACQATGKTVWSEVIRVLDQRLEVE